MSEPAATAAAPVLEVRGLGFSRRDERVFGPLDFVAHAGETLLVEGDNGSGKTTLLRILATTLHADEGEVRLDGEPLSRDAAAGRVILLGHHLGLKGDLTVLENLRYVEGLYGRRHDVSAVSAIESVELAGFEDEPVRQLSAGQRKRAALARLLLVPAGIWLLDEPWANLDRHGISLVNRLLERHARSGGTTLATSHGTVSWFTGEARRVELSP